MKKIDMNPQGQKIEFNEQWHTYTLLPQKRKLISSTKFIKQFFPPFELDIIASRVAKKNGISTQEQKQIWEDNKNVASAFGTNIHNYIEDFITDKKVKRSKSMKEVYTRQISREFLESMEKEWNILWCEKIVFNNEIAGTFDIMWQHKENKNHYMLGDFKTNKEIVQENRYYKYAYNPIKHLPDNNYSHYSLQLSLYKYLILSEGYLPKDAKIDLLLIHLNPQKFTTYSLNYYQQELNLMFQI